MAPGYLADADKVIGQLYEVRRDGRVPPEGVEFGGEHSIPSDLVYKIGRFISEGERLMRKVRSAHRLSSTKYPHSLI
jgi:hypothetical protein